ncbi:MAG: helix-turn-helix domain-containing protein, partial [Bdellovibrionota bacterium]
MSSRSLSGVGPRSHASVIDLVERSLVTRALQQCRHNQVRAARLLGISRNTLRHRIRKYNLEPP